MNIISSFLWQPKKKGGQTGEREQEADTTRLSRGLGQSSFSSSLASSVDQMDMGEKGDKVRLPNQNTISSVLHLPRLSCNQILGGLLAGGWAWCNAFSRKVSPSCAPASKGSGWLHTSSVGKGEGGTALQTQWPEIGKGDRKACQNLPRNLIGFYRCNWSRVGAGKSSRVGA
jgi:hypothetical protein